MAKRGDDPLKTRPSIIHGASLSPQSPQSPHASLACSAVLPSAHSSLAHFSSTSYLPIFARFEKPGRDEQATTRRNLQPEDNLIVTNRRQPPTLQLQL